MKIKVDNRTIPGGLLRFHLPEGSLLDQNQASARIISVLQSLPIFHRSKREIYVDAVFPLCGYQYIRDRFKTKKDLGTPLLAVRTPSTTNNRLGCLETSQRWRSVYQKITSEFRPVLSIAPITGTPLVAACEDNYGASQKAKAKE